MEINKDIMGMAQMMARKMTEDGVAGTFIENEEMQKDLTDAYFHAVNKKQIQMCMTYLTNTNARTATLHAAAEHLRG